MAVWENFGSAGTAATLGPVGWGMIGVSALGSILGASSSKKAASAAEEAQKQQLAAYQADLEFRQKMYNDTQAKYGPLEQQILAQATSNEPLGYDMLSGQIQQQYADALRNLSAMGYQGGGLTGGAGRHAQFGLATALPQAYAQGQMNRLNLGTSLLGRNPTYGLGQNISGAYQGLGNVYGQQAGMYGQLAGQGAGAIGQSLQGLTYGLGQLYQGQGSV